MDGQWQPIETAPKDEDQRLPDKEPKIGRRRILSDKKWCMNCKEWHCESAFGKDRTRVDGLASACRASRNNKQRYKYKPKPRPQNGRSFVPARDGDKKQARRRINYFVEAGLFPSANDLPCFDCGHIWNIGECRHEYDHYLGYAAKHHEHVQAVCSRCHHKRTREQKPPGGSHHG